MLVDVENVRSTWIDQIGLDSTMESGFRARMLDCAGSMGSGFHCSLSYVIQIDQEQVQR
jgi:hypothetical protein